MLIQNRPFWRFRQTIPAYGAGPIGQISGGTLGILQSAATIDKARNAGFKNADGSINYCNVITALLETAGIFGGISQAKEGFFNLDIFFIDRVRNVLNETVSPWIREIKYRAGDDAAIGYRGSLAAGWSQNPKKDPNPINLNYFDVDAFIVSDSLARQILG